MKWRLFAAPAALQLATPSSLLCAVALSVASCLAVTASARAEDAAAPRTEEDLPPQQVGEEDGVPIFVKEFLSPVYLIDKIYPSMMGPMSTHAMVIDASGPAELLWIREFRSTMVSADAETPLSEEFMCHTNLSFSAKQLAAHRKRFPSRVVLQTGRLFTLSQGQLDVAFPPGFGIPLMSDQGMLVNTQVLNHNLENPDLEVRHRLRISYVRDRDLEKPLKPLLPVGIQELALVEGEDGHVGLSSDEVDPEKHGAGCSLGEPALDVPTEVFPDRQGRVVTGFWKVPPGRDERTTRVTDQLGLPYDTTAHFIAVHVHPYSESLELRDRTTGETVFKSTPEPRKDQVGLKRVETFSSPEGLPLHKDHEYELISVYDNPTQHETDAMATMILYVQVRDLYDFDFRPRTSQASQAN